MLRISQPRPTPNEDPIPEPEAPVDVPVDVPEEAPAKVPSSNYVGRFNVEKVPQQIAVYMTPDMGPFACEHCIHWEAPNACGIVDGDIDPAGVCNLFQPEGKSVPPEDLDQTPTEEPVEEPEEVS